MKSININVFCAFSVLSGLMCGCQSAQYIRTNPQTHFDYPNSNVSPLGPVKAKIPGPSGFFTMPNFITSDSDILIYNAALSKVSGADLITDYTTVYKIYSFFPFSWSKLEIEGTACKMDVIHKDINK